MAPKGQNKQKKEQAPPANEQKDAAAPVADKTAAPKGKKGAKKGPQQKA